MPQKSPFAAPTDARSPFLSGKESPCRLPSSRLIASLHKGSFHRQATNRSGTLSEPLAHS